MPAVAGSCRPLPVGSGIFATCMACTCRLLPAPAGSCRLVVGHFQLVVLHRGFLHKLMSTGICKECRLLPALAGSYLAICNWYVVKQCRLLPGVLQVVSVWSLDGLWVIYWWSRFSYLFLLLFLRKDGFILKLIWEEVKLVLLCFPVMESVIVSTRGVINSPGLGPLACRDRGLPIL